MKPFKVNFYNDTWEVVELTQDEMYEVETNKNKDRNTFTPFGLTVMKTHTIYVNKEVCEEELVKTLRHEFMHAWMQSTANAFHEEYNEEHICQMVEISNAPIFLEVKRYMEERDKKE